MDRILFCTPPAWQAHNRNIIAKKPANEFFRIPHSITPNHSRWSRILENNFQDAIIRPPSSLILI
jgi:hypothetical protein